MAAMGSCLTKGWGLALTLIPCLSDRYYQTVAQRIPRCSVLRDPALIPMGEKEFRRFDEAFLNVPIPGRQNEQDIAGLQQAHPGAGGGVGASWVRNVREYPSRPKKIGGKENGFQEAFRSMDGPAEAAMIWG